MQRHQQQQQTPPGGAPRRTSFPLSLSPPALEPTTVVPSPFPPSTDIGSPPRESSFAGGGRSAAVLAAEEGFSPSALPCPDELALLALSAASVAGAAEAAVGANIDAHTRQAFEKMVPSHARLYLDPSRKN